MRILYISIISVFLSVCTALAGPGNYYNSIDTSKSCSTFKTALAQLITQNYVIIQYGSVDNYYNLTDLKPAESGGGDVVADKYSSENPNGADYCSFRYPDDFCLGRSSSTECFCYDKEHVFPKSWFGGADVYPMYSDIHFIWPADNYVNFRKGNLTIGYVGSTIIYTSKNSTKIGTSNSSLNYGYNSSNVFEPIDSFKGDFARAYLYVVTRYQDSIVNWIGRSTSGNVLDGNKYPGLDPWILQLCVKWHKLDPPSQFERKRNDAVQAIQGNRNPYIDYPHWVEKVFGINGISSSCVATAVKYNKSSIEFSIYPNPATNGLLNLKTSTILTEDAVIEVTDILGRTLISQKMNALSIPAVDVSNLTNGMYFLNLIYKDSNNVSSFIKE